MMTDSEVKDAVHHRDGARCQDCGITRNEHYRRFRRALEIHRLIPGSEYSLKGCVTLCKRCHARKPKTVEQALWWDAERTGIDVFYFNLYNAEQRRVYNMVESTRRKGT